MLEKLKRAFFWDQLFDQEWKHSNAELLIKTIFSANCIPPRDAPRWDLLIEGSKVNWKRRGPKFGLSPRHAVFNSMLEIADMFFSDYCQPNLTKMEPVLKRIAAWLWSAAPYDVKGPGVLNLSPEEHLGSRWKTYSDAHFKEAR
jgi:hypothetical protein